MRFAISTSPQLTTWPWLLDVWRAADDIEVFESGWTFDHFYPLFTEPDGDCLEGWTTLTALLQATERLRGGVLVTGIPYRHPAVLANMAATVDIVSNGRLELGIGAGWFEKECAAYGIDLGSLRERFDRFEEALAVITGMLSQETTTFRGSYFEVTDAMCNPKPVQSPLPICIGGTGLRRTIPLAARYAHHWNYGSPQASATDFASRLAVLEEHLEAEGRSRADLTVSAVVRGGDPASLLDDAGAYADAGADLAIVSVPKDRPARVVADLAAALEPLAPPDL